LTAQARDQLLRSTPAPTGGWSQHIELSPIPERFSRVRQRACVVTVTRREQQVSLRRGFSRTRACPPGCLPQLTPRRVVPIDTAGFVRS
jgi:hypothetical protein